MMMTGPKFPWNLLLPVMGYGCSMGGWDGRGTQDWIPAAIEAKTGKS